MARLFPENEAVYRSNLSRSPRDKFDYLFSIKGAILPVPGTGRPAKADEFSKTVLNGYSFRAKRCYVSIIVPAPEMVTGLIAPLLRLSVLNYNSVPLVDSNVSAVCAGSPGLEEPVGHIDNENSNPLRSAVDLFFVIPRAGLFTIRVSADSVPDTGLTYELAIKGEMVANT